MKKKSTRSPEPHLRDHGDCTTLTALTLEQLPRDGSLGALRKYSKGALVWASADHNYQLYFLKRGQIVIMLDEDSVCEVIIRVIKPGEPFGELCFCSARDQPRENCAKASVDSEVLEIGFETFMTYLRRDADALEAFAFTFCKRLADAEKRINVLSNRGATARLGRLLMQLAAEGSPSVKIKGAVTVALGHDELARMAAMTRPHVSVTMSKLRKLGLVHYSRGSQLAIHVARLGEHLAGSKD